jgi:uncharacterized DUF497 family protein
MVVFHATFDLDNRKYFMYIKQMKYKWDIAKNRTNPTKHAISFEDAVMMFDYPMLTCIDSRYDYGEERWVGIGFLNGIADYERH